MLKKYVIVTDSDKEPMVDCSLDQFLQDCIVIDFYEVEMDRDDLEAYKD